MTSTQDGAILKTDTKGRIRTPLARREQLLDEFERSSLSAAKFAALTGLKYQTFAGWVQRRRKERVPLRRWLRLRLGNCAGWKRWWTRPPGRNPPGYACSCPAVLGWR